MQLEIHFKKSGGGGDTGKGGKDKGFFQEKMWDLVCLLCFRNRLFIFLRRTMEINVSSKLCLSEGEEIAQVTFGKKKMCVNTLT